MIPPPPKGFIYSSRNSKTMARQFAISGLLNVLRKIELMPQNDLPLRIRNIRQDASNLIAAIAAHTGVWTTAWANELEMVITASRRASILTDNNGDNNDQD